VKLPFELAYLLGLTPWDRWPAIPPQSLRDLIEGPKALPPGHAIDLGCGMGSLAIYLAQHGWRATGVDVVERALRAARKRAGKSGVEVTFVRADVTQLDQSGISGPFELLLDCGCFHNMSDVERDRYVESINRVATQNAQFMLFALGPGRRPMWPRGARRADVERHFAPGWSVVASAARDGIPDAPAAGKSATWYRLLRNEQQARRQPETSR
jgi:cyclopropane fatty-acyl-phospholipid synthase-like methyltransferase